MHKHLIILFASALFLTNCTEVVKPTEEDTGREYYPLAIGNYWIYDITETIYSNQPQTQPGDSIKYQIRDVVSESYTDQLGQLTYRIIRSRRNTESQAWGQDSIITIQKTGSSVVVTRNNLKTVNLVFPAIDGKVWNGNAFNIRTAEEFTYSEVGSPFPLQDTTYEKTAKVVQFYNKNIIELDDRQEVYAYGVGLVYKRVIDFDYCNGSAGQGSCPFDAEFITRGIKRIQKIREFKIVK